jgi:SAM-dependent methyltransferase
VDRRADAFGRALLDWVLGGSDLEMYEREDGFIEAGPGPDLYLAEHRRWPPAERQALRFARGRVLDVGCGAGRVALHLQSRGIDVVGADASPLAVEASRRQGVVRTWRAAVDELEARIGEFDTLVLFGNNFGIFGTPERVRRALRRWARRSAPGTRMLAGSTDPVRGGPAFDAAYCRRNVGRGRMAGQIRLRIRYRDLATPWFPWLFVSPGELQSLVEGTGWRVARLLSDHPAAPYVAVLELA